MLVTTATELPRLMVCIGSRLMPAALPPDHDHEKRDEGNAAHWLSKEWFDGRIPDPKPGIKAYNGYVITSDMIDHVGEYLSQLEAGEMEIETTFSGHEFEVRGRADHISFRNDHLQRLTIDDFKYGYRIVEPEHNWTLIAHAIGWCVRNRVTPREIVLRIHQPRPYHARGPMREWSLSYVDLMTLYGDISQRLGNPTDELRAAISVCAKCHAIYDCPAARKASMNAIDACDLAFSDTLPNPVLAHEYETLERAEATIKTRREALAELMTHKIKSGEVITGYALQNRYANRTWIPGLTGAALSAASGKDLTKDATVTPAEAERRGVPKEVVEKLTTRAMIGVKLDRIDADAVARKRFG